jgi:hypothetical protein
MKSNKSLLLLYQVYDENIFEDRILLATIIEDITRLGERINSLEMDQFLLCRCIRRMLKEELTRVLQRN